MRIIPFKKQNRGKRMLSGLLLSYCFCQSIGLYAAASDTLWTQFKNVPNDARTKVWWFHGETETTKEGITADLEAYKRAGVGGVVYYDQIHGNGEHALDAFSPEWWKMFLFSAQEAKRLNLTFDTHLSNGFVGGGPWITPDQGMKMLLASDTIVEGKQTFSGILPLPERTSSWYADVATLAFPAPTGNCSKTLVADTILSAETGKHHYITIDMGEPFTARSLHYHLTGRGRTATRAMNVPGAPSDEFYGLSYSKLPAVGKLEVSDDGVTYRKVCDVKPIHISRSVWQAQTISFPAATGRFFRLDLHDWWLPKDNEKDMKIRYMTLSSAAKADLWEEKSGLASNHIFGDDTPDYSETEVVASDKIINLSDKISKSGKLTWEIPQGRWRILRFVCVPTGAKTRHGRKNLLGLECDKMSVHAAEIQWSNYFKPMLDTLRTHGMNIHTLTMDSHEAGAQNWTMGFEQAFRELRGYDLLRYLPVMAGYVVDSRERTDGVLYDVRRTIADLIADRYYGTLRHLCQKVGVPFLAQAIGNGLCIVGDPIQAKGRTDIPEGEFWFHQPDGNYDIKESSSAAHLYGKAIASAEAFTDMKYGQTLADAKAIADNAWCYGINQFMVCASAAQPWLNRFPGNTAGGRHYSLNRNNTYWDYSRPFWDYQARVSYMMRQGTPVVDFCVYLGGNAPIKIETYRLPEIPSGMDFDAFTSDALYHRMSVRNGRITLPDGMSYGMMILPREGIITLKSLRKISEMLRDGMKLYGAKPIASPSAEDLNHREEWHRLVNEIWGIKCEPTGSRPYGRGTVYWGIPIAQAALKAGMSVDIHQHHGCMKEEKLMYYHRQTKDADIYFLSNHGEGTISDSFTFRSSRRYAQWWNPLDGSRMSLSDKGGQFSFTLRPKETVILYFTNQKENLPEKRFTPDERSVEIDGAWNLWFDPSRGGVGDVEITRLNDWTTSDNVAIKYYSGTAVYRKALRIELPTKGERIALRFNRLCDVARVVVNGKEAGIVWCAPYELDITDLVRKGMNDLQIDVANSLMNRMILDASLPEDQRVTYSYPLIAKPDDALHHSGIIGPVSLIYLKNK